MGKIFDGLTRYQNEAAQAALDAIGHAGSAATQAAPEQSPECSPAPAPSFRNCRLNPPPGVPLITGPIAEAATEQYRILRTKLVQHELAPRVILISSAGPGDGKTLTSANLAAALALRSDAKVLLIDGDMRKRDVSPLLGLPASPGLSDVLSGTSSWREAVLRIDDIAELFVMPSGESVRNAAELLDSSRLPALLEAAREAFDYIVIDSPPIAAVADYELLQAVCDGVLVVVRPDHTNKALAEAAMQAIPPAKMLGVVVNCAVDWLFWKSQQSYYYGRASA